ncbi:transglycosylase domain-containing protein [Virgibacillus halodenitrificans]|uniref:transglycosylase domain-containing protein n=1 Tax=Virgibacillus halodenitrificans TaxID=1482 RepID=UPI000EF4A8D2|nr:transglycosylase domain-containing protein [Virgibacillus halodenitrificans]
MKKRRKYKTRNQRKRKWHLFKQIMTLAFLFFFLGLFIFFILIYDDIRELYFSAEDKIASIDVSTFKDKTETRIYDKEGNVIKEVAPRDYTYIPIEDVQPEIKNAVVAIEDIRFYEHKGYDLKALTRAGLELVKNKGEIKQGGSTITQQLAKLQFLSLEKSYKRKIEEIFVAAKLEKLFTKNQILEFYLNNINYGNGAYGIETASKKYFSKSSKELTLAEVAFLTGIPNNPSYYNPVRNMDHTLQRKNLILSQMLKYEMITEDQYQKAKEQEIVLDMPKKKHNPETYEVSFALSSVTKLLMEQEGFKFKYWFDSKGEKDEYEEKYNEKFLEINEKIRNGGFDIYTTIDMKKQKQLQENVNKGLAGYTEKDKKTGLYSMQGAAVTIDNYTGDVVAIVGGRTQGDVANTYNRAFLSHRQPGSIIKPVLVYTPAFERGKLASSVMVDKAIKNGPQNAAQSYRGPVTLREALERSINTIPFKIVSEYGPKEMLNYLVKMEFSGLTPKDIHAGVSIGGFTYGTTPLEMAGAYSTIARNGQYIRPTGIQKVVDITNTTLYENKHKKKRVYDSGATYLMTDVMKGVFTKRYGTAYGNQLSDIPSVGKTGTTNQNKDLWFAGYTPYYTTVVWSGYDMPKSIWGKNPSLEIWKSYMESIHKDLKKVKFEKPNSISYMYVNPETGEVDKTNDHGWWRKELVPEIYYEIQEEKKEEEKKKREEALKKRKEQEEKERKKREKAREELLELYDTTEEEVHKAVSRAENAIGNLKNISIRSKSDISRADSLMKVAEGMIDQIPLPDMKNSYTTQYQKQVNRLNREELNYNYQKEQEKKKQKRKEEEQSKQQEERRYQPSEPKYQPDKPENEESKEEKPKEPEKPVEIPKEEPKETPKEETQEKIEPIEEPEEEEKQSSQDFKR